MGPARQGHSGIPRPSKLPLRNGPSAGSIPGPTIPRPSASQGGVSGRSEGPLGKDMNSQAEKAKELSSGNELGSLDHDNVQSKSSRKPRQSLSDRTMGSLSQIPSGITPKRRRSSFFVGEGPLQSPVRPQSSMSSSRPGTAQGTRARTPSPTKHLSEARHLGRTQQDAQRPEVRPAAALPTKATQHLNVKARQIHHRQHASPTKYTSAHAMAQDRVPNARVPKTGNARASLGSKSEASSIKPLRELSRNSPGSSRQNKAREETSEPKSGLSKASNQAKSSAALRETIARAKAAHRAMPKSSQTQGAGSGPATAACQAENILETEDHGISPESLKRRIATARVEGRLNIASLGLEELPSELLHMYDNTLDADNFSGWTPSVDLVKLIAADNELESLNGIYFPENASDDSDTPSSVLIALETLDLHGNCLKSLPATMGNLIFLTNLNLARNRLTMDSLAIVSQIRSLKDLSLAENLFKGSLALDRPQFSELESLNISQNKISEITLETGTFKSLRKLNVAGNCLSHLPVEIVALSSVQEIDVSRNSLKGSLIPGEGQILPDLRSLDASFNNLTTVSEVPLQLPLLQILKVSENKLKALPALCGCPALFTIAADGNLITQLPEGIADMRKLKSLDLSRNDLRVLDPQIGLIDSLTALRLENNPLRERRLLSMSTEELKQELRSHIDCAEGSDAEDQTADLWAVQTDGVVDRSQSKLDTIDESDMRKLADAGVVRMIKLHHNHLSIFPGALELVSSTLIQLDLSYNKIAGNDFVPATLSFPRLKLLNLEANKLSSLDPLWASLTAPVLEDLNVSRNRLTALPVLRSQFPKLISLRAADNSIDELSVETLEGLHLLDVSSNEIGHLDPRIGLLGQRCLRTLLVGANRFRVPRKDVVEKGTEAILTWLRSRISDHGE